MALAKMIAKLEDVAEGIRGLYIEKDGKFILDVEGDEDVTGLKSALQKERDRAKELEKQMAKFKDIDPETHKELQKQLQELEEKGLKDEGKLDELLAKRTERMRTDFESQTTALTAAQKELKEQNDQLRTQLVETLVKKSVIEAIAEIGALRKEAVPDAMARGLAVWGVDEKGVLVPRKPDGTIIYGKDGVAPMTPKEWASELLKTAPHLFQSSSGGDSDNRGGPGPGGKYTPEQLARMTPVQKMAAAREQSRK